MAKQPVTRRRKGELYAKFECERGHKFDLGPIHDPSEEANEPDPDNPGGTRSRPGSGEPEHVPEQTECIRCFLDAPGTFVTARPVLK